MIKSPIGFNEDIMNNKLKFVESGKCSCKQQKTKEKIHDKYVVFGCGVMGHGQRIITDTE